MTNINKIMTEANELDDTQLRMLTSQLRNLVQRRESVAAVNASLKFSIGDRVVLMPTSKRSKWDFRRGVIDRINPKKIVIKLDKGPFEPSHVMLTAPASMLLHETEFEQKHSNEAKRYPRWNSVREQP